MKSGFLFKNTHTVHVYWEGIRRYTEGNGRDVPEKRGVYEILVKRNDGKYNRKYIGQTDNLNDRYFSHMSDQEENEYIRSGLKKYLCGFDYALIESKVDREDAEQRLYDKYRYPWNKVKPEGSGRNIDAEVIEHSL